jgi:hypothetical protein
MITFYRSDNETTKKMKNTQFRVTNFTFRYFTLNYYHYTKTSRYIPKEAEEATQIFKSDTFYKNDLAMNTAGITGVVSPTPSDRSLSHVCVIIIHCAFYDIYETHRLSIIRQKIGSHFNGLAPYSDINFNLK